VSKFIKDEVQPALDPFKSELGSKSSIDV